MSKFNVGDKVRIVSKNSVYLQNFNIDDICEIVEIDEDDWAYPYHILKLCVEKRIYGWPEENDIELLPTLEYIDDYMDTSKRILCDIKTCGKNLLDNFKIQNDFYHSIFNKKFFTNKIEEDASVEEMNNFYDMYINGIWKKEEEKDMNKVVNLWYERKRDKIIDKYDKLEAEFNTTKYSVVESFNELVQRFNEDLESLYKMDKATEQFVLKENAPNNVVKYCIDYERIDKEFEEEYRNKRDEELKEIKDIKDEVEAQLSLSDDLKYQQEVLERYNIINKKTKKIVG